MCRVEGPVRVSYWAHGAATCEGRLRVRKRFVRRDVSCDFPYLINFCGEPLRERNRFVCTSVLEKARTAVNADL